MNGSRTGIRYEQAFLLFIFAFVVNLLSITLDAHAACSPLNNGALAEGGCGDKIGTYTTRPADGGKTVVSQTFVAPYNANLNEINLYIERYGTPTDVNVDICSYSANDDNCDSVLKHSDIDVSGSTNIDVPTNIVFGTPLQITEGATYTIRLDVSGTNNNSNYLFYARNDDATGDGMNRCDSLNSGCGGNQANDYLMYFFDYTATGLGDLPLSITAQLVEGTNRIIFTGDAATSTELVAGEYYTGLNVSYRKCQPNVNDIYDCANAYTLHFTPYTCLDNDYYSTATCDNYINVVDHVSSTGQIDFGLTDSGVYNDKIALANGHWWVTLTGYTNLRSRTVYDDVYIDVTNNPSITGTFIGYGTSTPEIVFSDLCSGSGDYACYLEKNLDNFTQGLFRFTIFGRLETEITNVIQGHTATSTSIAQLDLSGGELDDLKVTVFDSTTSSVGLGFVSKIYPPYLSRMRLILNLVFLFIWSLMIVRTIQKTFSTSTVSAGSGTAVGEGLKVVKTVVLLAGLAAIVAYVGTMVGVISLDPIIEAFAYMYDYDSILPVTTLLLNILTTIGLLFWSLIIRVAVWLFKSLA